MQDNELNEASRIISQLIYDLAYDSWFSSRECRDCAATYGQPHREGCEIAKNLEAAQAFLKKHPTDPNDG